MATVKRTRFPDIVDERPPEKKKYRTLVDIIQNGPKIEKKKLISASPSGIPSKRDSNGVVNNHEDTTLKRRKRTMQKYITSSDSDSEDNVSSKAVQHRVETDQNKEHNIEGNVMHPRMLQLSAKKVLDAICSAAVTRNLASEGADSTMLMEFSLSYRNSYCFKGPLEDLLDLFGYLSISFGPGSSMPSLENLIDIFTRFGKLDMENTKISFETYRARVVFSRACDAKKALVHCMRENPFGNTAVTFHLGFAPDVNGNPDGVEATAICPMDNGHETDIGLHVGEELSPKAIAQKQIGTVQAMVDSVESNGGNWQEILPKLKAEIKVLEEKVGAIP